MAQEFDADGLVTGGDGYTVPADTDTSGIADHLEVSVVNCGVSNPNCPVSTGGIMLLPQEVGATISPLNLEEKFLEDGDELTYDISNSNPTIATLTITDDTLVVYDFLTPGTTEVTITASDGFCSESVSFTIDVYLDTDVDAINDDVDLDDDNDGILDVDEGCYYGALEFDGNQVLLEPGVFQLPRQTIPLATWKQGWGLVSHNKPLQKLVGHLNAAAANPFAMSTSFRFDGFIDTVSTATGIPVTTISDKQLLGKVSSGSVQSVFLTLEKNSGGNADLIFNWGTRFDENRFLIKERCTHWRMAWCLCGLQWRSF